MSVIYTLQGLSLIGWGGVASVVLARFRPAILPPD